MGNMWKLNINSVEELLQDPECGATWESVSCKGDEPGKISHHKAAVFGSSVVVFGGMKSFDNNMDAYEFDAHKQSWTKMK